MHADTLARLRPAGRSVAELQGALDALAQERVTCERRTVTARADRTAALVSGVMFQVRAADQVLQEAASDLELLEALQPALRERLALAETLEAGAVAAPDRGKRGSGGRSRGIRGGAAELRPARRGHRGDRAPWPGRRPGATPRCISRSEAEAAHGAGGASRRSPHRLALGLPAFDGLAGPTAGARRQRADGWDLGTGAPAGAGVQVRMMTGTTAVVVARGRSVLTREGMQGPGITLEMPTGEAALLVVRGFVLRMPAVAPNDHYRQPA